MKKKTPPTYRRYLDDRHQIELKGSGLTFKAVLLGFDSLDYWNQSVNERVLHNEIKKMDTAAKSVLAQKLLAEAEESQ